MLSIRQGFRHSVSSGLMERAKAFFRDGEAQACELSAFEHVFLCLVCSTGRCWHWIDENMICLNEFLWSVKRILLISFRGLRVWSLNERICCKRAFNRTKSESNSYFIYFSSTFSVISLMIFHSQAIKCGIHLDICDYWAFFESNL